MRWRLALGLLMFVAAATPVQAQVVNIQVAWCIPPDCIVGPTVVTGNAFNITNVSATLRGNLLDMGGQPTANLSFEWGKNQELGFETITVETNTLGMFNITILSLDSDTLYYFRAKAVNDGGTSYGSIRSFRTESVPTLFDSLLPVGLAISALFILIGLYAWSNRSSATLGHLLVFIGGLALIYTGFDYQQTIGDAQIALMIAVAGLAVVVLSSIEMVKK